MTAQRELRNHYIIAPKSRRLQRSDRNIDYTLQFVIIFLSLGQGRPHLRSVLLLQLVLSCGIVSLSKPVLKFFLARCPLLLAFLSPFFFLVLSRWRAPLISFY